jgi:hypothetical protein
MTPVSAAAPSRLLRVRDVAIRMQVSPQTVRRWARGIEIAGQVIRLVGIRRGKRFLFEEAALENFRAVYDQDIAPAVPAAPESPSHRTRRIEAARKRLKEMHGIG